MKSLTEYIESFHSNVKPPKADIVERWNTRIVEHGLHERGGEGAEAYLSRYGKGISAKKVADLALMAEHAGAKEMAAGFWEKAFQIENCGSGAGAPPLAAGKPAGSKSVKSNRSPEV